MIISSTRVDRVLVSRVRPVLPVLELAGTRHDTDRLAQEARAASRRWREQIGRAAGINHQSTECWNQ